MRSNSGSGKGKNNYADPTVKEHEATRRRRHGTPAHGRSESAPDAMLDQSQRVEAGPTD